ncbi:signal peptidase II [soil metagenome]
MSSPTTAWTRVAIVLTAIVAADQILKAVVTSSIEREQQESVFAGIKIVNVRNTGVAFGQLQDGGVIVAIVIALAVMALLAYFARHARRRLMWLPTGMLLGGALGNIIDRVREGAVVDFVKLPYWPAFNVADVAITFGVIVLLFVMEKGDGARGSA